MNFKKKPEIITSLEVSTAHITGKDNELLERDDLPDPVAYNYEFGFLVFVGSEDGISSLSLEETGFSKEFIHLMNWARGLGCKFLQIDRDGAEYEDLPKFVW